MTYRDPLLKSSLSEAIEVTIATIVRKLQIDSVESVENGTLFPADCSVDPTKAARTASVLH